MARNVRSKRLGPIGTVAVVALFGWISACTSAHHTPSASTVPGPGSPFTVPGAMHVLGIPPDGLAVRITAMSRSGAIVGYVNDGDDPDKPIPLYWSSVSAKPVHLATPKQGYALPSGIAADGIIVGQGTDGLLTWSTKSAESKPRLVSAKGPVISSISESGLMIGEVTESRSPLLHCGATTYPAMTSKPLAAPAGALMSSDCRMTSSGAVTATSEVDRTPVGTIWKSPSAQPVFLATPPGDPTFVSITGSGPNGSFIGRIGGYPKRGDEYRGVIWPSAAAQPVGLIPPPSGASFSATVVDTTGVIYGNTMNHSSLDKAFAWTSPTAKPRPLAAPSGFTAMSVTGRSTSGVLFGNGTRTNLASVPVVWTAG